MPPTYELVHQPNSCFICCFITINPVRLAFTKPTGHQGPSTRPSVPPKRPPNHPPAAPLAAAPAAALVPNQLEDSVMVCRWWVGFEVGNSPANHGDFTVISW